MVLPQVPEEGTAATIFGMRGWGGEGGRGGGNREGIIWKDTMLKEMPEKKTVVPFSCKVSEQGKNVEAPDLCPAIRHTQYS